MIILDGIERNMVTHKGLVDSAVKGYSLMELKAGYHIITFAHVSIY